MFPGDVQIILDEAEGINPAWLEWDFDYPNGPPGTGDPQAHGVILCHATTQPACFIARYPGSAEDPLLTDAPNPLDISGSGRISENVFTSGANTYEDEAVLIFFTQNNPAPQLMLPQELQSTGDDIFRARMKTGLQPSSKTKNPERAVEDTHRLDSIEPFVRRGVGVHPGNRRLYLNALSSYVLDDQTTTIGVSLQLTDLTVAPTKGVLGPQARGRAFGLNLMGSTPHSAFRYLGAILRGRRLT